MARQEELFAQTIMDMKRVLQRPIDDSESDDTIDRPTNRGNKLKRKAKYVEEGRLDLANPYTAYRKRIKYNGYDRTILSRNTIRVDIDGDVVDGDEELVGSDVEDLILDPYREVDLLGRLMPLTSAAELKDHPSLSLPYTEKYLEEIIRSSREMVQREQNALWRMKKIAPGLRGDSAWMPLETFESEDDMNLIHVGNTRTDTAALTPLAPDAGTATMPSPNGFEDATEISSLEQPTHQASWSISGRPFEKEIRSAQVASDDAVLAPALAQSPSSMTLEDATSKSGHAIDDADDAGSGSIIDFGQRIPEYQPLPERNPVKDREQSMGESQTRRDPLNRSTPNAEVDEPDAAIFGREDTDNERNENGLDETMEDESANPPHRMTTRAKAQAANSPTLSRNSSPDNAQFVDPFFQIPPSCLPGRDLGLPYDEADDTRRVMSAYIQKQEEVVRSASKLYNGLLKAKRLRDEVLEWCTAEGHVGEMSDGEDWYDKEKWGLTEDLEKGKDIEEEEVTATGKKTRNRRNVA